MPDPSHGTPCAPASEPLAADDREAAALLVLADPIASDKRRSNARRTLGMPACGYCERNIAEGFGPRHNPSSRCESGGQPHCTCDVCF